MSFADGYLDPMRRVLKKPDGVKSREDSSIFKMIETAAHAYNPAYGPMDKAWLPSSIRGFLYTTYNQDQPRSYFLEFAIAKKPKTLEELGEIPDDFEFEHADQARIYAELERIYMIANQGYRKPPTTARKKLIKYAVQYYNIYMDWHRVGSWISALYSRVGTFEWFAEWCIIHHIWDDMPVGALDPKNQLWEKAVGELSEMAGCDITRKAPKYMTKGMID